MSDPLELYSKEALYCVLASKVVFFFISSTNKAKRLGGGDDSKLKENY